MLQCFQSLGYRLIVRTETQEFLFFANSKDIVPVEFLSCLATKLGDTAPEFLSCLAPKHGDITSEFLSCLVTKLGDTAPEFLGCLATKIGDIIPELFR